MFPTELNAPPRRPASSLSIGGAIVPCCLGFDLLAPGIVEGSHSELVAAVVSGIVLAQFGLFAVWAVLGSAPWFVRQPAAMVGIMASFIALMFGARADVKDGLNMALSLPLIFLCLQAPLWGLRLIWGWQLIPIGGAGATGLADARRFSLAQLFAAITAAAIAMSLARAAGFESLPVAVAAAVFGLVVVIPCVGSALAARYLTNGTFWILAYAVVATMAVIVLFTSINGAPTGDTLITTELFSISVIGTMHAILAAVRLAGFDLQRASQRSRAA